MGILLLTPALLGVYAALLWAAHLILNKLANGGHDGVGAVMGDNLAVTFRRGAFYVALGIALHGTFNSPGDAKHFVGIVFESALWGALALGALLLALWINDKVILARVDNTKQLEAGNLAVGIVEACSVLGTAFVYAGAMQGTGSILTTIVFFLVGQGAMVGIVLLYENLSKHKSIVRMVEELNNCAAGVLLGGKVLAISLVVMGAIAGDFRGWRIDIMSSLLAIGAGAVILFVVEYLVDLMLLPNKEIHELIDEKRVAPALLVAAIGVATALIVTAVSPG